MPLMAMYGLGPLAGLDGGGFMSDLVLVPYADAMLIPLPATVDPIAVASLSDNIPDGWRAVGPFTAELAGLDPADRRVLVIGRLSIGLYAAALAAALGCHVDYVDTDPAASPRRKNSARSCTIGQAGQILGAVSGHREHHRRSVAAGRGAARDLARRGVHRHRDLLPAGVEIPMLRTYTRGVRFVTGRVSARGRDPGNPGVAGGRLRSVAGRRPCRGVGGRAIGLADDDRQNGVQPGLADAASPRRYRPTKTATAADLPAGQEGQPLAVAAGGQNPRVGDVDVLADEVQVGLTGGQHVLYPIRFAVGQPDRQHVALAVGGHDGFVWLAGRAATVLDTENVGR